MVSGVPRGAIWASIITFGIGAYLIYSGIGAATTGYSLALTGGDYSDIYTAFGGLWKFFGFLYLFLGILCIIIAAGLLLAKEWARRNGVILFWAAAVMTFFYGMVLGFLYSLTDGVIPFIVLGISAGMALRLRSTYLAREIEFRGQGTKPDQPYEPHYRKLKMAQEENRMMAEAEKRARKSGRIIRHAKTDQPAHPSEPAPPPPEPPQSQFTKCERCGTANKVGQEACTRCGAILDRSVQ